MGHRFILISLSPHTQYENAFRKPYKASHEEKVMGGGRKKKKEKGFNDFV